MNRTPEVTYRIMSAVKSKDTQPERLLASALWNLGVRYRKHYRIKDVGRPDFVMCKKRIAVFCDGDFWHGNNWRIRRLASLEVELAGYSDFWRKKILGNIERDKRVNAILTGLGWSVFRFWASDIQKSAMGCAIKVNRAYIARQRPDRRS